MELKFQLSLVLVLLLQLLIFLSVFSSTTTTATATTIKNLQQETQPISLPLASPSDDIPGGLKLPVIYINHCYRPSTNSSMAQQGAAAAAGNQEIEFSTNTTIFRLRILDQELPCSDGQKPRSHFSKDHTTTNDAVPPPSRSNEDVEYYYYDDDDDEGNNGVNVKESTEELAETVYFSNQEGVVIQGAPILAKLVSGGAGKPAAVSASAPLKQQSPTSIYIAANGELHLNSKYYHPADYCVARSDDESQTEVQVCEFSCSTPLRPCLRKCCEFGSTFDTTTGRCSTSMENVNWKPKFIDAGNGNRLDSEPANLIEPQFEIGIPANCLNGYDIWPFDFGDNLKLHGLQEYTKLQLHRDGSIQYLGRDRQWQLLDPVADQYCIDSGELISMVPQNQMIVKCRQLSYTREIGVITTILATLYTVSTVFLTFIAIIFLLLWNRRDNAHNWIIFAQILSFLIFYGTLTANYFLIIKLKSKYWLLGSSACVGIAIVNHFSYISIFSWMTVVNFDFWTIFHTPDDQIEPTTEQKVNFSSMKRVFSYLAFGLGIPGAVIGIGVLMDHIYREPETGILVPEYGQYFTCSMSRWAEGLYTYFAIGVLYVLTLALIVKTYDQINTTKTTINKELWKSRWRSKGKGSAAAPVDGGSPIRRETDDDEIQNNGRGPLVQELRKRKYIWFTIFINISIICGLSWIVGIISFIVFNFKSNTTSTTATDYESTLLYVQTSDLILAIQPVGIFIIFVSHKDIWRALRRKYAVFEGIGAQLDKLWSSTTRKQQSAAAKMLRSSSKTDTRTRTQISTVGGGGGDQGEDDGGGGADEKHTLLVKDSSYQSQNQNQTQLFVDEYDYEYQWQGKEMEVEFYTSSPSRSPVVAVPPVRQQEELITYKLLGVGDMDRETVL